MSQPHPVPRKTHRVTARQLPLLDGADQAPGHWVRGLTARWLAEDGPDLPHLFERMGRSCRPLVRTHGYAAVEAALARFCAENPLQDAEGSFTRRWPDYRRT